MPMKSYELTFGSLKDGAFRVAYTLVNTMQPDNTEFVFSPRGNPELEEVTESVFHDFVKYFTDALWTLNRQDWQATPLCSHTNHNIRQMGMPNCHGIHTANKYKRGFVVVWIDKTTNTISTNFHKYPQLAIDHYI
jgi:hypothetical protein